MKKYLLSILIVSAAVLLSSCDGGDPHPTNKGRVLMVYMAADEKGIQNDPVGKLFAILEWAKSASPDVGDIIIYRDKFQGNAVLEQIVITNEGAILVELADYGKQNSADATQLKNFIAEARRRFPSRDYGLLVFSHSSGWMPAGGLEKPLSGGTRSIVMDDNVENGGSTVRREMELSDFAAALPDGLFDFILFETCLTANVEVAYELRNKADYIVASAAEIVAPGFEESYLNDTGYLLDTENNIEANLIQFAQGYMRWCRNNYGGTISVVKTQPLDELAASVKAILAREMPVPAEFDNIQYFDRYALYTPAYKRYFDLGKYIELAATPEQLSAFAAILDRTVVWEGHTATFMNGQGSGYKGINISTHCGLTVYAERAEFEEFLNPAYRRTSWYKATR